jgi:hypothetical protein
MMRLRNLVHCLLSLSLLVNVAVSSAVAQKEAIPDALKPPPPVVDPKTPPARPFHDRRDGIAFQIPAGWNLTTKDGDVSTFRLDARSVGKTTRLRAVASIGFNPLPRSTFSGALFYASVTPGLTAAQCKGQAAGSASAAKTVSLQPRVLNSSQVAGIAFDHGHDEHGGICTESRDEIYTAARKNGCYRFDLVVNSFCGGDVSGVRDMTERELDSVRKRLDAILNSVTFDRK